MKSWCAALVALIPFLIGIAVDGLLRLFLHPMPVLVFKIDVGIVALLAGLLVSFFTSLAILVRWRLENRFMAELAKVKDEEVEKQRRFIRRLDHELKNPLTGLQAALANIQEAGRREDRRQAATGALQAIERLSKLLADLRKLSDLDERTLEIMPVDLAVLLDEIVAAFSEHPLYGRRSIHLMVAQVPWPLPPVRGDRDLLGVVFYNLVHNALKFSGPMDIVEVRARADDFWLVVEVADSGPGIPPEDMANIFEELYRGANARGVEGSGLGLALVKRIVNLHRGEVEARSRLDGDHGTVVTVRLPLSHR